MIDFPSELFRNRRYDIGGNRVARHFVELRVADPVVGKSLKLIVGKALQAEAFYRHQPSDDAVQQNNAVYILCRQRIHRLIGTLEPSAALPDFESFRCQDGSCAGDENAGMLAFAIAYTRILSCGDTSGERRELRVFVHIDKIQPGLCPLSASLTH